MINSPRAKQERRERLKNNPSVWSQDCLMYTCELTSILWFTGMINVSIKQKEAFPCILIVTSVISPRGYTVSNRSKERVTDYLNIYFNLISHPRATVLQQSYFSPLKNLCFEHISGLLYISDLHLNTRKFFRDLVPFESGMNEKGNGQFLGHRSGPWGGHWPGPRGGISLHKHKGRQAHQ